MNNGVIWGKKDDKVYVKDICESMRKFSSEDDTRTM